MAELLRKKKHINVITAEFKPYWEQLFAVSGIENPLFYAKLCYQGSEFEAVDDKKSECIRFYASEISKNQDIFVELFDWFDKPYEEGYRNLYKLKNTPDWRNVSNFSVEVTHKNDGTPLPAPTYSVRLTELELISKNKIETAYPAMTKTSTPHQSLDLNLDKVDLDSLEEEPFTEKEDNHYAQMTIRDIYCIVNKVPLSNKKWLNTLIDEGKKWQK